MRKLSLTEVKQFAPYHTVKCVRADMYRLVWFQIPVLLPKRKIANI